MKGGVYRMLTVELSYSKGNGYRLCPYHGG